MDKDTQFDGNNSNNKAEGSDHYQTSSRTSEEKFENSNVSGAKPEIGKIYEGTVVKVLDFGAFVNFGFGHDGMVHIKEVANGRVDNIHKHLAVGQTVKVQVLGFDDKGRCRLSVKKVGSAPELTPVMGEVYDGTVLKVLDFGVFVDFGFERDGMVHISEISPERVDNIHNVINIGDKVKVKFLGYDDRGRVKLSIRRVHHTPKPSYEGPPPEVGEIYQGMVVKVTPFGAFVDFGFGRDGMVHISELADYRVEDVNEVVSIGSHIPVKLLAIVDGRYKLSLKQAQ